MYTPQWQMASFPTLLQFVWLVKSAAEPRYRRTAALGVNNRLDLLGQPLEGLRLLFVVGEGRAVDQITGSMRGLTPTPFPSC